jgi:hypothetical protein
MMMKSLLLLLLLLNVAVAFPSLGEGEAAPEGLEATAKAETKEAEHAVVIGLGDNARASRQQMKKMQRACKFDELNAQEVADTAAAKNAKQLAINEADNNFEKRAADAKSKRVQGISKVMSDHNIEMRKHIKEATQSKVNAAVAKNDAAGLCAGAWKSKRDSARAIELTAYQKASSTEARAREAAKQAKSKAVSDAQTARQAALSKADEVHRAAIDKVNAGVVSKKGAAADAKAKCIKGCTQEKGKSSANKDAAFNACTSKCGNKESAAASNAGGWGKSERTKANNALKQSQQKAKQAEQKAKSAATEALNKAEQAAEAASNKMKVEASKTSNAQEKAATDARDQCIQKAEAAAVAAEKSAEGRKSKLTAAAVTSKDTRIKQFVDDAALELKAAAEKRDVAHTNAKKAYKKAVVAAVVRKAKAIRSNIGCQVATEAKSKALALSAALLGEANPMSVESLEQSHAKDKAADEATAAKIRKDAAAALKAAKTAARDENLAAQAKLEVQVATVKKQDKEAAAQDKAQAEVRKTQNESEERASKQEREYLASTQKATNEANVAKLTAFKKKVAAETKVDQRTADKLSRIRKTYLQKVAKIEKNSKAQTATAERDFKDKKKIITDDQAVAVKAAEKERVQQMKAAQQESARAKAAAVAGKARAVAELAQTQSKQDEKGLVNEDAAAGIKQAEADAAAAEAESKSPKEDWELGENGDMASTKLAFGLDSNDEGLPPVSVIRGGDRAIERWISQH